MKLNIITLSVALFMGSTQLLWAKGSGVEVSEGEVKKIVRMKEVRKVYEKPDLTSEVVDTIYPITVLRITRFKRTLYPGEVIVMNKKLADKFGLKMGELILYYGSVGESLQPELKPMGGEKRLYDEGFDSNFCPNMYDPNFEGCWLKVKVEPTMDYWQYVEYGGSVKKIGWIYEEIMINDVPQEPGMD